MIPSTSAGLMGTHLIHMEALPLHRQIESLWKRWLVESAGEIPSLSPSWRPMLLMAWMAVSLQPPRDSATKGMNIIPTKRQASAWATIFLSFPTETAWPWVVAASVTVSACKGEITVTSSAAGRLYLHCGI